MPVVIISTMADPRRPAVTVRVEFETEEMLTEWLDTKYFLEERHRLFVEENAPTNTGVIIFRGEMDLTVETRQIQLRWDQLQFLMEVAEDVSRPWMHKGSGRPPRRALQATTSKERRLMKRAWL